jgi:hypothetical protein
VKRSDVILVDLTPGSDSDSTSDSHFLLKANGNGNEGAID